MFYDAPFSFLTFVDLNGHGADQSATTETGICEQIAKGVRSVSEIPQQSGVWAESRLEMSDDVGRWDSEV